MLFFIVGLLLIRIFYPWFWQGTLSAGDWPYLFAENIKEFSWMPEIRYLWLAPYYQIVTKIVVQYLRVPWEITEKLFWFLPFVLLSLWSSYRLTKSALGSLIYTTNTYALMIVGGGQLGVAFAYALAPLVLKFLMETKKIMLTGLIVALQVSFDPRITALTVIAALIYYGFIGVTLRKLFFVGICVGIAGIFNLYWIVPLLNSHAPIAQQLGETTIASIKFLSFATFEQTISLVHPNWPENIFGKIYFMQPEFLVVAILAFSSLIFKPKTTKVLYFAVIALIGAFLAKGANPPFGEVYIWLFTYVPGFSLFRDPSKFYLYPVLAFSVLIPFAIQSTKKIRFFSLLFILFWSFTIREALLGQLSGTFKPTTVPHEYVRLKDFLVSQQEPFQTLWIPERQRFGFASKLHPAVDARLLTGESSISGILAWINSKDAQRELSSRNIKYIVVGYDSRGELFLTDRKYDETVYDETLDQVTKISWLHKEGEFGKIGVFEVVH